MLDMSARAVEFISRRFRILPLSMAGAPVYFAAALPGPGTDSEAMLPAAARPSAGRVPSGRGLSQASALAGCLGEAAELISASFWGDENFVRAPFSAVRSEAIHPASLLLFSDQQYHQRQAWNAANRDEWVPVPYDDERLIEWVEGASPDDDRRVLIPAAFAYIGYAEPGEEAAFAIADSNGCAAGSTWEGAVAAGFQELVERDAVALWWFGAHRRPAVDLSPITETSNLVQWLKRRSRIFHVLDLTTDLAMPVYAAVSATREGHDVALGTAANFDPLRAVVSAITEMLQTEIALQLQDSRIGAVDAGMARWISSVSFESLPQLQPSASAVRIPLGNAIPNSPSEVLTRCIKSCRDARLEIFTVDLTRSEIDVPVVRVVVPGLRPGRCRFAPGRLYDVPFRLGWRSSPMRELDLNKVPLSL